MPQKVHTTTSDWFYPDIKMHRNTFLYSGRMFCWAYSRLLIQLKRSIWTK